MQLGDATIANDLTSLELRPPGAVAVAVYDREIGLYTLHEDPISRQGALPVPLSGGGSGPPAPAFGRTHVGRARGAARRQRPDHRPRRLRALSGRRRDATSGDGQEPCLFVLLFHGPFDVALVED